MYVWFWYNSSLVPELREKSGSVVLEDIEAEGFELGVAFLWRVQVGKNSVASCEAQAEQTTTWHNAKGQLRKQTCDNKAMKIAVQQDLQVLVL